MAAVCRYEQRIYRVTAKFHQKIQSGCLKICKIRRDYFFCRTLYTTLVFLTLISIFLCNPAEVIHKMLQYFLGTCHHFLVISCFLHFFIVYIIKGVMFVCHDLCSVWPAKRLGRLSPNLTHALLSTQGVFLARSMSRSFAYVCGTDRSTKHPEHCAKATPGERCSNYVRTTVITARVTRRGTEQRAAARVELRPEVGYLQLVYYNEQQWR